ncbi:hypothetical protein ACFL0T_07245 [Candidatus Omnitrophota bacterium]
MTYQNSKYDNFKENLRQRVCSFVLELIELKDTLHGYGVSIRIACQLLRNDKESNFTF